jgi:hypothetical protein
MTVVVRSVEFEVEAVYHKLPVGDVMVRPCLEANHVFFHKVAKLFN